MDRKYEIVAAVGGGYTVVPVVVRDGTEGLGYAMCSSRTREECEAYVEACQRSYTGRLFHPNFPVLFKAEGERCSKMRWRSNGAVPLQCVRRAGHTENHLMDIRNVDADPQSR